MAEVMEDVVATVMEKIKDGAEAMAEKIKDIAETTDYAKTAEDREADYVEQIKRLNEYMANIRNVVVESGLKTEEGCESDGETVSEESGTETEDSEQGSPVKKPGERTLKSSNSTEGGPESPVPARMEGLVYMIYTPGRLIDGVIMESEETQLKREIEARQAHRKNFEESLIKAEKLPEQPSSEGAANNVTTAESNSELSKEHVEDVLKSDDSRDPVALSDETIAEKPNLVPVEGSPVKSKSENSAPVEIFFENSESSVGSAQDLNSGDAFCVNTPNDSATEISAETLAVLENLVSKLKMAQLETRFSMEKKSVDESPENLTESKIALNSKSLNTETSAVDVPVDSSPKFQNGIKPRKEPCKQRYTIIDDQLQAEELA